MAYDISIIASAYRTQWWEAFMSSLVKNNCNYEVIFVGQNAPKKDIQHLKYIHSASLPAQCYEIARRAATGRIIHWTADDAEYTPYLLDKTIAHLDSFNDRNVLLSIQTIENRSINCMSTHRFKAGINKTPLMCPLGLIYRDYLTELGGFDKRYAYGQWENDVAMRAWADGGRVELYEADGEGVHLDHQMKHIAEHKPRIDGWYKTGREVLEESWMKDGVVTLQRNDTFQPYPSNIA